MSKLWAFHRRNLAIRVETNRKYADVVAFFFKAYRNSTFNKCLGLDDDVFARFSRFSSLFAARDVSRGGRAKRPWRRRGRRNGCFRRLLLYV